MAKRGERKKTKSAKKASNGRKRLFGSRLSLLGSRSARKKALLIGVNKYKVPGADLRGCVNDVENISRVIQQYCGFSKNNVRVLTDFKATTDRIESEIAKLTSGPERGDVLYLHFSGHGSNVPDKNGDEADNRDEILCPTDLDWSAPLLDDWLRETFKSLPSGVNLSVVFDCCHSGSATRAILPPDAPIISRYLPCPLDLMAAESGRALRGKTRGRSARARRTAKARGQIKRNVMELLRPT